MSTAANGNPNWTNATSGPWNNKFGNQGAGPGGWGGGTNGSGPGWGGGNGWGNRYWGMMPPWLNPYTAKPLLIVAMVLGFIFWWPIGLVLLGVMLWNRHLLRCGYRYYAQGPGGGGTPPWASWKSGGPGGAPPSSGNRAFDEYRAETLRRLEEEQKDFGDFLDRLRVAKDKAEFDQFMNDRRTRPADPPPAPEHPAQS